MLNLESVVRFTYAHSVKLFGRNATNIAFIVLENRRNMCITSKYECPRKILYAGMVREISLAVLGYILP